MASGDTLLIFTSQAAQPADTSGATFDTIADTGNGNHLVLDFDDSALEDVFFRAVMPQNYAGGNITVRFAWTASSATSGDVEWHVQFKQAADAEAYETEAYATAQTVTDTASTAGQIWIASVTVTAGANTDNVAAGDALSLRVYRDGQAGNSEDTMSGDAELHWVELQEA